ncbi:MAG TPA: hemerythrin domain-containing protein [Ramlibacter sp.]|nr:hemerythrin domain-containing protein [Ramlibacter sp.]
MTRHATPDAQELLEADHRAIEDLFGRYAQLAGRQARAGLRADLADRICVELAIHGRLEQELVYPALREALRDDDAMDEADAQHDSLRELTAQVLAMDAGDRLFDARMAVLADYALRHFREEEMQLFSRVRETGVDMLHMGRALAVRKEELRAVADALREDMLVSLTG